MSQKARRDETRELSTGANRSARLTDSLSVLELECVCAIKVSLTFISQPFHTFSPLTSARERHVAVRNGREINEGAGADSFN